MYCMSLIIIFFLLIFQTRHLKETVNTGQYKVRVSLCLSILYVFFFPISYDFFFLFVFSDYQKFLKENTSLLVQKVKNFDPIIDDLDFHDELVANMRVNSTNQEKMRKLLTCVNCESIAKDLFNALCKHEKRLMDELLKRY